MVIHELIRDRYDRAVVSHPDVVIVLPGTVEVICAGVTVSGWAGVWVSAV